MPLTAANAERPMATRMPLIANTAVQRLCATATIKLAPPTALHLREFNRDLLCRTLKRFGQYELTQLKTQKPKSQSKPHRIPFIKIKAGAKNFIFTPCRFLVTFRPCRHS